MALVFIVNLIVGFLVGLSSIAGFLLPIFYLSVMQLSSTESLALSFLAFVVSGVIASLIFYQQKILRLRPAIWLSVGSIFGSMIGVALNLLIPESIVKVILYSVVLLSGLSILFKKNREKDIEPVENKAILVFLGFITAIICAISGAGGPILVLPILILLGYKIHEGIAIALFNSIFIGIPASLGYFSNADLNLIISYIPVVLAGHGLGVFLGSKSSGRINQKILKQTVALFSIGVAVYNLFLK